MENTLNQQGLDQIDREYVIFNQGFAAGKEHTKPSKETVERFQHIEARLADIVSLLKTLTDLLKTRLK